MNFAISSWGLYARIHNTKVCFHLRSLNSVGFFFLSFSLVFISDIVDGIRRVGRRFDSYRHML